MKVCSEPSCPTLTDSTYCGPHASARRQASDRRRPNARRRGYDKSWERTRRNYLAWNPVCQDEAACIAPATDVHHLDGLGPSGPRGHDFGNLQSLCHEHHSSKTATEQPGGWNA